MICKNHDEIPCECQPNFCIRCGKHILECSPKIEMMVCADCVSKSKTDPINPSHYQTDKYQVIDIIEGFGLDYHLGNVIKYVLRAGKKGDKIEDLKKARWYLDRIIEKR